MSEAAGWSMPYAISTLGFGIGVGVAASKLLGVLGATVMSLLMYSGTAQLVTIDLWAKPIPLTAMLLAVLSINARYLAMSATLAPFYHGRRAQGLLGTALLSDASWVLAHRAKEEGKDPHAALMTCNLMMWVAWIGGTMLGGLAGSLVPERLTTALGWFTLALLATLLPPLTRGPVRAAGALVGATLALMLKSVLGGSWAVLIAGLSGAALVWWPEQRRTAHARTR